MSSLPIDIPTDYELVVTLGQEVSVGDILAQKKKISPNTHNIDIPKLLGVSVKKALKSTHKSPGDIVQRDDVIASHTGFFWQKEVVSNITATLIALERDSGVAVLEEMNLAYQSKPFENVIAPVSGKIDSITEDKIIITSKSKTTQSKRTFGGNATGKLILIVGEDNEKITGSKLTSEHIGNILLGNSFDLEAYVKASGMGVAGIVVCEVEDNVLEYLTQKQMLIPIMQVDEKTFKNLSTHVNKEVKIDSDKNTIHILS